MLPILIVSIIVSITFVADFTLLDKYQAPSGADYGNYLTQVDILNGNDLRGWGLRHQPVYFMILDLLVKIFNDDFLALKVGASLVFSLIAIPLFMLLKKLSGSNIASAIATGLYAFFISNTEMISWGGNPNFLAFSFMILALYFIIDLINKPSKKSIILSGFFLSLVIGTHILVTVYTFGILGLFVVLSFVFVKNRKEKIKGNIKNMIYLLLTVSAFSLPYVTFYLTYFKNSAGDVAKSNFVWPYVDFSLASADAFWRMIVINIAVLCIGAAGTVWLAKHYIKVNRSNALLLSSLFIVPITLFMVTSQPLRWLYFLPIPFLICFGIYSKNLFVDTREVKKASIKICVILFIFTTVMLTIDQGKSWFNQATTYYQFIKEDEIEALNWISKYTAPDAIFATSGHASDIGGGGNSYAWWIEGYANRTCMFTGDLEFYSFQFEKENVRTTNRIFAGTYIANYSNLEVSDSVPLGEHNPLVTALIGDQYEDLFAINDVQNYLQVSPAGNGQSMAVLAGFGENGVVNVDSDSSKVTITVTYDQPEFLLTRSLIMTANTTDTDVVYHITPKNSTISEFKINVWSLFETSIDKCNINQNSVAIIAGQVESTNVTAEIKVVENNGQLCSSRVIFSNPSDSKPVVNYIFRPQQNDLYVHLKITIITPTPEPDPKNPSKYGNIYLDSAYSQLESLGVDYVLVSKYRSEYFRFLYDPSHFSVAFQNGGIAIFKVINYSG